jgi:hypothetical protein
MACKPDTQSILAVTRGSNIGKKQCIMCLEKAFMQLPFDEASLINARYASNSLAPELS